MAANGTNIIARYITLKNERHNFDWRWEIMAPFLSPSREGITTRTSPGEKQGRNVYDSTGMMAAELSSHFIAGHVIDPAQQWFGLRMRQDELNRVDAVREWLEESRDRMLKRFSASSFYAEGPEALIDWVGFGTGNLTIEELPQPINKTIEGFRGFFFRAERTGRFVIAENASGLVDTQMNERRLTARAAKDQWGEENLPPSIRATLAKAEIDKQFTFVHSIIPRPKTQLGPGNLGMPWESAWTELESKHVVSESGFNTFPRAVFRYHKTPGEVYGRGRGDIAMADIWSLNTAKRMGLEDHALKIRPPVLQAHDSVIGTLRLKPGAGTSVNTHGRPIRDVILPFDSGARPDITNIKEEQLRRSIQQIFFIDQILALMEIQKTEMTAFEFAKKIELLFRLLGPVYGRLEWEFLTIIIDIAFDIMLEAGDLSPPPAEVFESDGQIDVVFENAIAKSQRAGDVEAMNLAIQDLTPIAQIFPQIWDGIDPDKYRVRVFEVRGFPAIAARNEEEILALRAERQEQQEKEVALADATETAKAIKDVTPLVKVLGEGQQGGG